jgi:2,4-dienoyl-CoA reductase-like NADH-dependent reductase (Old Yellow Enzyme family)
LNEVANITRQDDPLFTPVTLGDIDCRNRVFMAPMTRSRADANDWPSDAACRVLRGAGLARD